jgi:ribonuclease E
MSKNQMIINYVPGEECRVAIVEDAKLEELHVERFANASRVGNIYVGRVNNVEPAIQAAFVDFGVTENGFLHVSDLHPRYFPGEDMDETTERVGHKTPRRERPPIQHCLKRGQEVIVQVLKEGVGTKGPTLTSYLSIPGRFLVMMPQMDKVGVSRKVEDEEQRREMRQILDQLDLPEGFGFILRTAGMERTKTELKRDLAYLQRLWKDMERRLKGGSKPRLLYSESDLLVRSLRDLLTTEITEVVIDNDAALKRAARFMKIVAPRGQAKLLHYPSKAPVFHAFGIEQQIAMIHAREVPLPSGGRLVIDQTEALVAIDVNSGKSRDARDAERNAYQTNVEAVDEICRQLRLRDLGGIVVNDLIDMRDPKHRRDVEARFRERLKRDRARTTTAAISLFGILEMTRQRMRGSHESLHFVDCPTCRGRGLVQKPDSVAADALRDLAALLDIERVGKVEMVVAPRVAGELLSTKRLLLNRIERTSGKRVDVRVSEAVAVDRVSFYAYDPNGADLDLAMLPAPRKPDNLVEWELEISKDELDSAWAADVEEEKAQAAAQDHDFGGEEESEDHVHPIEIDEAGPVEAGPNGGFAPLDEPGAGGKRRRRRRGRGRGRGDFAGADAGGPMRGAGPNVGPNAGPNVGRGAGGQSQNRGPQQGRNPQPRHPAPGGIPHGSNAIVDDGFGELPPTNTRDDAEWGDEGVPPLNPGRPQQGRPQQGQQQAQRPGQQPGLRPGQGGGPGPDQAQGDQFGEGGMEIGPDGQPRKRRRRRRRGRGRGGNVEAGADFAQGDASVGQQRPASDELELPKVRDDDDEWGEPAPARSPSAGGEGRGSSAVSRGGGDAAGLTGMVPDAFDDGFGAPASEAGVEPRPAARPDVRGRRGGNIGNAGANAAPASVPAADVGNAADRPAAEDRGGGPADEGGAPLGDDGFGPDAGVGGGAGVDAPSAEGESQAEGKRRSRRRRGGRGRGRGGSEEGLRGDEPMAGQQQPGQQPGQQQPGQQQPGQQQPGQQQTVQQPSGQPPKPQGSAVSGSQPAVVPVTQSVPPVVASGALPQQRGPQPTRGGGPSRGESPGASRGQSRGGPGGGSGPARGPMSGPVSGPVTGPVTGPRPVAGSGSRAGQQPGPGAVPRPAPRPPMGTAMGTGPRPPAPGMTGPTGAASGGGGGGVPGASGVPGVPGGSGAVPRGLYSSRRKLSPSERNKRPKPE